MTVTMISQKQQKQEQQQQQQKQEQQEHHHHHHQVNHLMIPVVLMMTVAVVVVLMITSHRLWMDLLVGMLGIFTYGLFILWEMKRREYENLILNRKTIERKSTHELLIQNMFLGVCDYQRRFKYHIKNELQPMETTHHIKSHDLYRNHQQQQEQENKEEIQEKENQEEIQEQENQEELQEKENQEEHQENHDESNLHRSEKKDKYDQCDNRFDNEIDKDLDEENIILHCVDQMFPVGPSRKGIISQPIYDENNEVIGCKIDNHLPIFHTNDEFIQWVSNFQDIDNQSEAETLFKREFKKYCTKHNIFYLESQEKKKKQQSDIQYNSNDDSSISNNDTSKSNNDTSKSNVEQIEDDQGGCIVIELGSFTTKWALLEDLIYRKENEILIPNKSKEDVTTNSKKDFNEEEKEVEEEEKEKKVKEFESMNKMSTEGNTCQKQNIWNQKLEGDVAIIRDPMLHKKRVFQSLFPNEDHHPNIKEFPTVIGTAKIDNMKIRASNSNYHYIGRRAMSCIGVMKIESLFTQLKYSLIDAFLDYLEKDEFEQIKKKKITLGSRCIILSLPTHSYDDRMIIQSLTTKLFEKYETPYLCFVPSPILTLHAVLGASKEVPFALVVDVGHLSIRAIPIYQSKHILYHYMKDIPIGGQLMTELFSRVLLMERSIHLSTSSEMEMCRDMKEKCCYVKLKTHLKKETVDDLNYKEIDKEGTDKEETDREETDKEETEIDEEDKEEAQAQPFNLNGSQSKYQLKSGDMIHLDEYERTCVPELLFDLESNQDLYKPASLSGIKSIQQLIIGTIETVSESLFGPGERDIVNSKKEFYNHIIICGGTARLPNFSIRLVEEMKSYIIGNEKLKQTVDSFRIITTESIQHPSISGAALYAQHPLFLSDQCISLDEYLDGGISITERIL